MFAIVVFKKCQGFLFLSKMHGRFLIKVLQSPVKLEILLCEHISDLIPKIPAVTTPPHSHRQFQTQTKPIRDT